MERQKAAGRSAGAFVPERADWPAFASIAFELADVEPVEPVAKPRNLFVGHCGSAGSAGSADFVLLASSAGIVSA